MKKYFRSAITIGFLSVMVVGLVFALTGCGLFGGLPTAKIATTPNLDDNNTVSASTGDVITFDGSGSTPGSSDGTIDTYTWNFGDGNTADGEVQTHSYTSTGTYTVELEVMDNNNKTDADEVTAEIS